MRVRTLDLYKTFGADGLVTTACLVKVRGIVQKANGAFGCVFVEHGLKRRAVDTRIPWQLNFLGSD